MEIIYNLLMLLAMATLIAGIAGLIKPKLFSKYLGKRANRKFIPLSAVGLFFVIAMIGAAVEPAHLKQARLDKEKAAQVAERRKEDQNKKAAEVSPEPAKAQTTVQPEAANPRYYWHQVTSVVDGDTVRARVDGKEESIRIIGMNSPESTIENECFGKEARAKELLTGKWIQLESDSSQTNRDKYNRLLRFVWMPGEIDFGKQMISEGYAYEYTYNSPYKYQAEYKTAQKTASDNSKGLWSQSACNGEKSFPTSTPTPQPSAAQPAPAPAPSPNNTYYANCSAARAAGAAPIYAGEPGYRSALDRDGDGVACE
jgi:micrococcal nuclease